ncbi:MAG: nucleotidyltransferase family protein, partial [Clostridia bacterium]|nr:nucleotidyltransferase family protein [Clostridia bacterium]
LGLPGYTVLLGATEAGRAYLKELRKTQAFPIITKPADREKLPEPVREQYRWLERADRLYTMCTEPAGTADRFMRMHPAIKD